MVPNQLCIWWSYYRSSHRSHKKAKTVASNFLKPAEDIEFKNGNLTVTGTDKSVSLIELSSELKTNFTKPDGIPDTLDVVDHGGVPSAFPNGCHICEVEIDPDTGAVKIDRYNMVNDFGVLVNPLLVEGQCHGGVAQGIGQAIMEDVVFDRSGQVLSGSFMDYALPAPRTFPIFILRVRPVSANKYSWRQRLRGSRLCRCNAFCN